jgi:hypothetical protein
MSNLQEQEAKKAERGKTFHIIVNTRAKDVHQEVLTFEEISNIAFPTPDGVQNPIFTVTFKDADQKPSSGTLVAGESVKIKNGTIFNVTRTAQS